MSEKKCKFCKFYSLMNGFCSWKTAAKDSNDFCSKFKDSSDTSCDHCDGSNCSGECQDSCKTEKSCSGSCGGCSHN